jgi:cytochrome c
MRLLGSLALAMMLGCMGCSRSAVSRQNSQQETRQSAPDLMVQYGCPACHVISAVPGAVGKVGPSLDNLAQRSYLAGTLENSHENLGLWIQHPQRFQPGTAMPEMGVTSADAETIAHFLEQKR